MGDTSTLSLCPLTGLCAPRVVRTARPTCGTWRRASSSAPATTRTSSMPCATAPTATGSAWLPGRPSASGTWRARAWWTSCGRR
uniref:Putative secreted protein n=1 Tax=Ixodes ricinus TaxID=34613 RepID=A0A6B0U387_IXORI